MGGSASPLVPTGRTRSRAGPGRALAGSEGDDAAMRRSPLILAGGGLLITEVDIPRRALLRAEAADAAALRLAPAGSPRRIGKAKPRLRACHRCRFTGA